MDENMEANSKFVKENRIELIDRLPKAGTMSAADCLLEKGCISSEDWANISQATTRQNSVRELYDAMTSAKPISHFVFYNFLKEKHSGILKALERVNKPQKRKETSEDKEEKRRRTQDLPATETETGPGPDQNQGQEARNETDSGSTPDFQRYTLSAMHEYLEDPVKSESMIRVLKSKLGEEGMEKLEKLLEGVVAKRAVHLNHEDFKNISKNQALADFIKSGKQPNLPTIVISQFFEKIRGYYKTVQEHNTAKSSRTQKESGKINGVPQKSANSTINNDPRYSTPNSSAVMRAEISEIKTEDSGTGMPVTGFSDGGYKTLNHDEPSLSIHGSPPEFQREYETPPGAPSGDYPQTSLEDIGAANEGRHDRSPQNSANGTINNDPGYSTPNSSGVMRAEISEMETEDSGTGMPVAGFSDGGYKTLNHDEPSLCIHGSPPEFQRECETPPGAPSGDYPQTSLEDIGAANEGRHDRSPQNSANGTISNDPSSLTPSSSGVVRLKTMAFSFLTAQSTPCGAKVNEMETEDSGTGMPVTGFFDSGYKTLNHDEPSLSIHGSPHEAHRECETPGAPSGDYPQTSLDVGAEKGDRDQDQMRKPKKGQSKPVREKKMLLRNYLADALRQWAMKQIPSEKSGRSQEEELKKIKDAITIVDIKQHPLYPLLLAVNCKVFKDPQTHQRTIIEIPDRDQKVLNKNGQLTEAMNFRVQFHMWVLDVPETVVLLKDGNEKSLCQYFEKGEQYKRYLQEVVVPVFAVFKKVQREKELF